MLYLGKEKYRIPMWKILIIFLLTAFIVHLLYRNPEKSSDSKQPTDRSSNDGGTIKQVKTKQKEQTVPPQKRGPRGVIVEPNEFTSGYSIAYYDVHEADSDYSYLSSQGYQGGGPSWEGILYGLLKIKDPDLLQRIEFDAEGDGLVINGTNRADLEKIALWIDDVKADRKLMQRAIMMANIDGRME